MKFYQSPLAICSVCLIAMGTYFTIETILNPQSWGLLIGIPAFIVGGVGMVLHFVINRLTKFKLKDKIIMELLVIIATIMFFAFYL